MKGRDSMHAIKLTALAFALCLSLGSFARLGAQGVDSGAVEEHTPERIEAVEMRSVVELFTSQGCSSCPPADALLHTLAADPKLIALTFPVDYWDYLGWKDTLASSRNSDRQRAYAKARGDGAIYTPQLIVNGLVHVNGAQKGDILNAIEETNKQLANKRIPIWFWQERNTINIATGAIPQNQLSAMREATIWFGVVQASAAVDIKHGENAGKTLVYTNVVRELTPIGLWRGQSMKIQIPRAAIMLPETQKSVVLIQEGKAGPIIAAAWAGLF